MHDNAPPHVVRCVQEYFQGVSIHKMEWPAHSPDLKPVEHTWDMLKRMIKSGSNPPQTLNELRNVAYIFSRNPKAIVLIFLCIFIKNEISC